MKIKLGSKVKDTVTKFRGIAVSRTEYLQGCSRIAVQPENLQKGKPIEPQFFDEPQLEVIKEDKVEANQNDNGGVAYAQPPAKTIPK